MYLKNLCFFRVLQPVSVLQNTQKFLFLQVITYNPEEKKVQFKIFLIVEFIRLPYLKKQRLVIVEQQICYMTIRKQGGKTYILV